jgi:hypothetical protein
MVMKSRVAIAVMGVTLFLASPSGANDDLAAHREGLQLVRQVEEVGRDVQYHTDRLTNLIDNTSISRWTHYHHLDEIKRLVNTGLRPALVRLDEIQRSLPPWKQKAVDKMIEAAKTLSSDTSSAFMTKAENPNIGPAMNEEYRTLVSEMHRHADAVATTSRDAAAFAEVYLKVLEAGISPQKS